MNRDAIKYIAMLTMLLNHISNVFMTSGTFWAECFKDIGYFTMPVMCYFLVEGYHYTHSKKRYSARLAIFAVVSELPFCLAFTKGAVLDFVGMNMIFTLLLCFTILLVLEFVQRYEVKVVLVVVLAALSLHSDWAVLAPIFTLLFAWAANDKQKTAYAFLLAMGVFALNSMAVGVDVYPLPMALCWTIGQVAGMALAAVVIVFCYNGKRMKKGKTFSKWFFYIFYPGHLLILGLLRLWFM